MTTTAPPPEPAAGARQSASTRQPRPQRKRAGLLRLPRRLAIPPVRDWRVQTKLGAVLAVPAVAFLIIAGLQIGEEVRGSSRLGTFSEEINVGDSVLTLVHDLQIERDRAAGCLATPAGDRRAQLLKQYQADADTVEHSRAGLAEAVAPLTADSRVTSAFRTAGAEVAALHTIRDGVRGGWLRQRAVFEQYTHVIDLVMQILPTRFDLSDVPELQRTMRSFTTATELHEYGARLRGRLYAAATAGTFDVDDDAIVTDLRARQNTAMAEFRSGATGAELAKFDQIMGGEQVVLVTRMQQAAMARTDGQAIGMDPTAWWQASTGRLDLIDGVERGLLTTAMRSAGDLHSVRGLAAVASTVAIVLIVAGTLLLSWTVGRSMVRSLRALRTQALDVAQHRLPEAIERLRTAPTLQPEVDVPGTAIRTSDEIGEVSEAFTVVHRRAVMLAAEQAVMRHNVNAMFVNLARRSQVLVERQIQLLDQLESAETDPGQLDNLFRLDHLATRMRRNDENLLVLAGGETIRRRPEPVRLPAVVLAATSEIEQYARIRRDVDTDICVAGHAVSDLVHLLAELLENATAFSPPDSAVVVHGHTGPSGQVTLLISDNGIGMTPEGFTDANARVRGTAGISVSSSERMGLVVVGHLAARHRIQVSLNGSPAGVTASVVLPPSVLTRQQSEDAADGQTFGRTPPAVRRALDAAQESTTPPPGWTLVAPRSAANPPPVPALPALPTVPALPTLPAVPVVPPARAHTSGGPQAGSGGPQAGNGGPGAGGDWMVAGSDWPATRGDDQQPWTGEPGARHGGPATGTGGPGTREPAGGTAGPGDGTGGPEVGSGGPEVGSGGPEVGSGGPEGGSTRSLWWSGGGNAGSAPAPAPRPAAGPPKRPVIAGTSSAGLPLRVPMAQRPTTPAPASADTPATAPSADLDPSHVSATLSAFYSGARRGAAEEGDRPLPPWSDRSSPDAEPASP